MIRGFLRRLIALMVVGVAALASMSAVSSGHTAFAASTSSVKVLAKEVNGKYVFGPTRVTIKVGQTVVWKNTTDAPHTVTSTTAGWTYDKKLNLGKSLQLTFKRAGTFHYKCSYHPGMVGTVIVSH